MSEPAPRPQAERPGRLTVGVVGAGRVGAVLGAALQRAGHRVVAVAATSEASRTRAEAMLPGAEILPARDVVAGADLALLSVPDDVLPDLVTGLVDVGAVREGQLLAHTSGRHGIGVLEPALRVGALPLALHPVTALTGTSLDLGRLSGCCFGVTAPDVLRPIAEALVIEMGGEPVWVPEEHRPLYHAALTVASDHLVTLVAQAADLLQQAEVADPRRLLAPLVSAAVDQALAVPDVTAGPVARGDVTTVAAHRAELDRTSREAAAAYVTLARLAADRALAAGALAPDQAEALLDVLAAPTDREA
ncbi:MAG: DUF2520 domain-containing protein [Streptosporangiales bacterium]|nr:DUF2520 domain-containing protein [Streptosporangiales bacterium]